MSIEKILGTSFHCSACQRTHSVSTKKLVYADDAVEQLVLFVQNDLNANSVTVVADKRTFDVVGKEVVESLQNSQTIILPDKKGKIPVCDDVTKEALLKTIPQTEALVAVGSGVINDLVKWVAHELKIPYVIMATAASMNGYSSSNVAASVNKVKVLVEATAPAAVFAIPCVIENAPYEMTTAGLGDVLAKTVSSVDWKLNEILFGEYYCQYLVDLVAEFEPKYLSHPEAILARDKKAIKALFEALFYSGIAMTLAGTSAPASGGEHLLSHTLDMLAQRDHQHHDFHGRQVGVGTILSAALYDYLLKQEKIDWKDLPSHIDEEFWGEMADEIRLHYGEKIKKTVTLLKKLQNWSNIRSSLTRMVKPAFVIKNCLQKAGAAHLYSDIYQSGAESFGNIWLKSHEMRSRFTVLDLAFMAGVLPDLTPKFIEIVRKK